MTDRLSPWRPTVCPRGDRVTIRRARVDSVSPRRDVGPDRIAESSSRRQIASTSSARAHGNGTAVNMGPCMSVVGGVLPAPSAETEGPYAMYSTDSTKWLDDARRFGIVDGSASTETPETFVKSFIKHNESNEMKIDRLFGLSSAKPMEIRYCTDELGLSVAEPLDGATIDATDAFSLIVGFAPDLQQTPVGVYHSGAYSMMKPDVKQITVPLMPAVHLIDLFLEIDGKKFEDGHICIGDGSNSKAQAIKAFDDLSIYDDDINTLLKESLTSGPSDKSKPWATIAAGKALKTNHAHFPLIAKDAHEASTDLSSDFCHALLTKFSQAIKTLKPGSHTFKIQVRPRGVFHESLGEIGWKADEILAKTDYAQFCQAFPKHFVTDPNTVGSTATWTMTTSATNAKGPTRSAHAFSDNWPSDEIQECVDIAMSLSGKGPAGAVASKAGCGQCAHIILVGHGIENRTFGKLDTDDWFQCFGLYKSKDGKPNSLGAQIEFGCKRVTMKDGIPVSDPQWECSIVGRTGCTKEDLTNSEIDAAIARDAHHLED